MLFFHIFLHNYPFITLKLSFSCILFVIINIYAYLCHRYQYALQEEILETHCKESYN